MVVLTSLLLLLLELDIGEEEDMVDEDVSRTLSRVVMGAGVGFEAVGARRGDQLVVVYPFVVVSGGTV